MKLLFCSPGWQQKPHDSMTGSRGGSCRGHFPIMAGTVRSWEHQQQLLYRAISAGYFQELSGSAYSYFSGPSNDSGSERKQLGLQSQLYHLLIVWCQASYLTALCISFLIWKMEQIDNYLTELLWGIKELIGVKHLKCSLTHSKHISVSHYIIVAAVLYYYYCNSNYLEWIRLSTTRNTD